MSYTEETYCLGVPSSPSSSSVAAISANGMHASMYGPGHNHHYHHQYSNIHQADSGRGGLSPPVVVGAPSSAMDPYFDYAHHHHSTTFYVNSTSTNYCMSSGAANNQSAILSHHHHHQPTPSSSPYHSNLTEHLSPSSNHYYHHHHHHPAHQIYTEFGVPSRSNNSNHNATNLNDSSSQQYPHHRLLMQQPVDTEMFNYSLPTPPPPQTIEHKVTKQRTSTKAKRTDSGSDPTNDKSSKTKTPKSKMTGKLR